MATTGDKAESLSSKQIKFSSLKKSQHSGDSLSKDSENTAANLPSPSTSNLQHNWKFDFDSELGLLHDQVIPPLRTDSGNSLHLIRSESSISTGLPEITDKANTSDHSPIGSRTQESMGNNQSRNIEPNRASTIISEVPDEPEDRKKVQESQITGNCRPWSENVYYKLFMDTQGRDAKLMVLKCEISYVDIFTDDEHCLYKSRFIGAKAGGVASLFVFDLMKSSWEEKLPKSQAIELNIDIVMSSSPIHNCSDALLRLLLLEKSYLKHLSFDGQLNIMMRFAHAHGWDSADEETRNRVHNGLRSLYKEGVNLEVMSSDIILEEMRVDGLNGSQDDKIKPYILKRRGWKDGATPNLALHKELEQEQSSRRAEEEQGTIFNESVQQTQEPLRKRTDPPADAYHAALHRTLLSILNETTR